MLQAKVPVFEDDTPDELAARVLTQEHQIYPLVVHWFCQGRLKMVEHKAWLDGNLLPAQSYANDESEELLEA